LALLGRRETRDLLERHGLRPKTSLGQHFLVDPNTIRKIVRAASISPGENVLEIGAGVGALTIGLASAGASVIAIEQDRRLEPALSETLARVSGVEVVWGDALTLDYDRLLGGRAARVVSNLPYQVATPLVLSMLIEHPSIAELLVMVQQEVGERLIAIPMSDAYGSVSAKISYLAEARVEFKVSRAVFMPEPDVESVVVRLTRRPSPPVDGDRDRIFAAIDAGFATRRKTIRNALRGAGLEASEVQEGLDSAGVDGSLRAEALGLAEFAAIASALEVPKVRR
jgi:16S rRNA (adenine1518-N6/adenine1519-N6)-dimethyltransferase